MNRNIRPTGIIRTLPTLYGDSSVGAKNFQRSIRWLEKEQIPAIYIAFQVIPKVEILHIYLLINGFVEVRMNIADYQPGDARECWDKTIRQPRIWAVCSAPVSRPFEPLKMRGFQGFRYTEELW